RPAETTGGENKAEILIGDLGPAVEVVRKRIGRVIARIHAAVVQFGFVPVGSVVRARRYDASDAFFLSETKHVIGHVERIALYVVTLQIAQRSFLEPLPRCAGIHARMSAARVVNDR